MLCNVIQCYTVPYSAIQCYTVLYSVIQCYTVLYSAIKCYTLLYSAIQCYKMLYIAIQQYTILYHTILYLDLENIPPLRYCLIIPLGGVELFSTAESKNKIKNRPPSGTEGIFSAKRAVCSSGKHRGRRRIYLLVTVSSFRQSWRNGRQTLSLFAFAVCSIKIRSHGASLAKRTRLSRNSKKRLVAV